MSTQDSSALMKVLAGILEDAVRALQRIEKKIGDQTKLFNDLTERIGKIEGTINNSVTSLAEKEIPNLERTLTQKINDLGLQNIDEIDTNLDQTIMKLQKSIQILSIQNLVTRIENLATVRSVPTQKVKKEASESEAVEKKESQPVKKAEAKTGAASNPQTAQSQPVKEEAKEPKKQDDESLIKPSSFFGS